jgi:putative methyltransferase (TIGR04325 family)
MHDSSARYAVGDLVPPPYYFDELPEGLQKAAFDDPFNTPGWIDHCRHAARKLGIRHSAYLGRTRQSRIKRALAAAISYARSPALVKQALLSGGGCSRHLQPIASMITDVHLRDGKVSVLDVGGGFGDNFFELLRVIDPEVARALRYEIVDNEPSCALGRELFAGYEIRPAFTSDHTSLTGPYDIVMMIGTLQYLPEWRRTLGSIVDRAARYAFIARSPIVEGTSFTTVQHICPAYGSFARRSLGATQINVVGLGDLRKVMGNGEWRPMMEWLDTDYSTQFARLPERRRGAAYYVMAWAREPVVGLGGA